MRRHAGVALVAALALAWLAAPAAAQAPDAGSRALRTDGLPDATAWWSADGRAGWAPDTQWLGVVHPWTLAGLVRGAWSLDDAWRMPGMRLGPGIAAAHEPLAGFDSLAVARTGGDGGWQGFEAGMVPVRGVIDGPRETPGAPHTLTMYSFQRGSSALEDNALTLARDDSTSAMRFEVGSGNRGAVGPYEDAGEHRYGLALRLNRGTQRFEGTFAHRGAAMAITDGAATQSAMGGGGSLAWTVTRGRDVTRLEARRITDWHESEAYNLVPSRRDQVEQGLAGEWSRALPSGQVALRAEWTRAHVRRDTTSLIDPAQPTRSVFDAASDGWWSAARAETRLGVLAADGTLGFGAERSVGNHIVVAPSLGLAVVRRRGSVRARVERVVTPVWSDLAPGTAPFLQDTWTGALEAALGDSARHVGVTGRVGRTLRRAVASRWPLEELWLRDGYEMDSDPYRFALVSLEAAWGGPHGGAKVEAFALARNVSPLQPNVDPGTGARGTIQAGTQLFKRELDARLRFTAAVIGARESETTGLRQPPYVTFGAGGVFTLVDVIVVVEAVNLENTPHPLTWIDPRTGEDALGPGLESRITFSWKLFN